MSQQNDYSTEIDGVAVAELVARHGSPVFVFSERSLRQAIRMASAAFQRHYEDVQFAWSYKTNYLKAVCAIFHEEGSIAEVVSDFEYEKARALGLPGGGIIYNGPYKPAPALERALADGARIQIDNLDELLALSALAENKKRPADVAIRVYLDAGVRPVWSKFGFDADSNEAARVIERLARDRHLRLVGLHTHIGTRILDPSAYARATSKLLDLADYARRECRCEIAYLNLGGGFAAPSQSAAAPAMDAYAAAICEPIKERWPRGGRLPRLYLETGRALLDDAGYLITTIHARKRTASADGGEAVTGYVVDAGIHLLPEATIHGFTVRPAKPHVGPTTDRTLFGCLCMNTDVLCQAVALPALKTGDQLVLHPIGAYNLSQSMQFITYRPRVVMVGENGQVAVIRERENLEYVEALEKWMSIPS